MAEVYNHKVVEKKWQKVWDDEKAFAATNDYSKPKYYALVEFPYPSGQGLHVGHPRPYTALDIVARKRRMQGYNVLYPMGWDAFGLPTENYAIKNKIHPKIVTENNVKHFKDQLHSLGYSFDWDREINTTDPKYYKWTQWIFLKLFKAGLAYKKEMPINWCTSCKVGLANEEVVNGVCERCGAPVVRKVKSEWMLKITDYADKLIEGLNDVDYIERVKVSQKNWIGRSTGAEVDFQIKDTEDKLRIYTTRCDTLFGVTYMVVSPEHPYLDKYKDQIKNWEEIVAYREQASRKSDFERAELAKDKTGVAIDGLTAINPVNGKEVPIWVSDYVLMSYGTGAIMAVPAHDERDWEFAKKFHLPIIQVVAKNGEEVDVNEAAFTDVATGVLINSDFLNGLEVKDAKEKMIKFLEEKGIGQAKTNYKLRDWVFSRQRYWGEPIPIVHCPKCGNVPVPEEELPLRLPEVESYEPTGTGESPLAAIDEWVNCKCPVCGSDAKRETNTMPQWAGSSWYFLRYVDNHNSEAMVSREKADEMLPVDMYIGGVEHAVLHLLYSRFYTKFLNDIGVIDFDEPFKKLFNQGMITGKNGIKMSKSKGNVIYADELVDFFGVDAVRYFVLHEMPFENDGVISWELMVERLNSDLANTLGNLVNRTISMTNKYLGGVLENKNVTEAVDDDLKETVLSVPKAVEEKMDKLRVADAITEVFRLFKRCNKYIDETMPWALAKDETKQDRLAEVLYNLVESISVGATLLESFMPETSDKVLAQLGAQKRKLSQMDTFGLYPSGNKVTEKPEILFARMDINEVMAKVAELHPVKEEVKEEEKGIDIEPKEEITFEEFGKMQFQVGEIISCEAVKKSKKLLCSQVKIGSQVRQIVSGIKSHYSAEEMVGKKVMVVTNLKPAKLAGILSEGMILCAEDADGNLSLMVPEKEMPAGAEIC